MAEKVTDLLSRLHPLLPQPSQPAELMALGLYILSALVLIASGYRLGRYAFSGFFLAFAGLFCARAMEALTKGTPLWIPAFLLPGSLAAILMFGLIGLIGRLLGMDEMDLGRRMVLAGLTTVIGTAAILGAAYAYLTQDLLVLAVAGLILLVIGIVVQFVQARDTREFHSYDDLYDMPLEIPDGLTDRQLWGKEE